MKIDDPRVEYLLGEQASTVGVINGVRPDVIYRVEHGDPAVVVHLGIFDVRRNELSENGTVIRLLPLQAAILSSVIRARAPYNDLIGTPEPGEKVYGVFAEMRPNDSGGYEIIFGAYDSSTKELDQIARVILTKGECAVLSTLLTWKAR
jgi:hypothetical protein